MIPPPKRRVVNVFKRRVVENVEPDELIRNQPENTHTQQALFRRYFVANEDISARDVLVAAAEEADVEGAGEYLDSGAGVEEVNEEVAQLAEANDVHGVPYFIIDDKFAVSGAQEPAALAQLITRAMST